VLPPMTLLGFAAMTAFTVAANLMLKLVCRRARAPAGPIPRARLGVDRWARPVRLRRDRLRHPAAPRAAERGHVFHRRSVCRGYIRSEPGAGRAGFAGMMVWYRLHLLRNLRGRSDGAGVRPSALPPGSLRRQNTLRGSRRGLFPARISRKMRKCLFKTVYRTQSMPYNQILLDKNSFSRRAAELLRRAAEFTVAQHGKFP
jgi:hypothetical protein